jgi:hypothetical protein
MEHDKRLCKLFKGFREAIPSYIEGSVNDVNRKFDIQSRNGLMDYFQRLPNKSFYNPFKERFEKIIEFEEVLPCVNLKTAYFDNSQFIEINKYKIPFNNNEIPKIKLIETNKEEIFKGINPKELKSYINNTKDELAYVIKVELDNPDLSAVFNHN